MHSRSLAGVAAAVLLIATLFGCEQVLDTGAGLGSGNSSPSLTVATPSSGDSFSTHSVISVTGTVDDADGDADVVRAWITEIADSMSTYDLFGDTSFAMNKSTDLISEGSYTLRVQAQDSKGNSSEVVVIPISVGTGGGGTGGPAGDDLGIDITGLALQQWGTTVFASWDDHLDVDTAGGDSYTLYRSTDGGVNWTPEAWDLTAPGTVDSSISIGTTYLYSVAPVVGGTEGEGSAPVSITIQVPSGRPPTAGSSANGEARIIWAPDDNAVAYLLTRSVNGGVQEIIATPITTSYTDSDDLGDGDDAVYNVSVVDADGVWGYESYDLFVHIESIGLDGPSSIDASAISSPFGVALTWDSVPSALDYTIYRAESGDESFQYVDTTPDGTPSYTDADPTLEPLKTYTYYVVSNNGSYSGVSPTNTITLSDSGVSAPNIEPASGTTFAATLEVSITAAAGTIYYRLNEDGVDDATGILYTGPFTIDSGDVDGENKVKVVAVAKDGSELSTISSATYTYTPTLDTPSSLGVAGRSSNSIDLSWSSVHDGDASVRFVIERGSSGSGPWTAAGTTDGTTSFTDTGLSAGTPQYYRVKATPVSAGTAIESGYSNTVPARTLPAKVTGLVQQSLDTTSIDLSWNATAGAVSYNIYREETSGGAFAVPVATEVGATGFSDPGVTTTENYFYRVEAVGEDAGLGEKSDVSSEMYTPLPAPALTPARDYLYMGSPVKAVNAVTVSWLAETGAVNYDWRSKAGGGSFTAWSTTTATDRTIAYADSNTTYTLEVRANRGTTKGLAGSNTILSYLSPVDGVAASDDLFGHVEITWDAHPDASGGYEVYDESDALVASVGSSTTSFVDVVVDFLHELGGIPQYYWVRPLGAGNDGHPDKGTLATGEAAKEVPDTQVQATLGTAVTGEIELSWETLPAAVSYEIYYSYEDAGPFDNLVATGIAGTGYTDASRETMIIYRYLVYGVDRLGNESTQDFENYANIWAFRGWAAGSETLSAADDLSVVWDGIDSEFDLTWTWPAADGGDVFRIEREADSNPGVWRTVAFLLAFGSPGDTQSFSDDGTDEPFEAGASSWKYRIRPLLTLPSGEWKEAANTSNEFGPITGP